MAELPDLERSVYELLLQRPTTTAELAERLRVPASQIATARLGVYEKAGDPSGQRVSRARSPRRPAAGLTA